MKNLTGLSSNKNFSFNGLAIELCEGSKQELAEIINNFFQSVSNDLDPINPDLLNELTNDFSEAFTIDQLEVERTLLLTNIHKSPNWILHDLESLISGPVCAIFNSSVRNGVFPSSWKMANVVPILKLKPPKSVENDIM